MDTSGSITTLRSANCSPVSADNKGLLGAIRNLNFEVLTSAFSVNCEGDLIGRLH